MILNGDDLFVYEIFSRFPVGSEEGGLCFNDLNISKLNRV